MIIPILAKFAGSVLPGVRFNITGEDNAVFLTFDDGPHPDTTPRILEILAKHDAKATFFCLGCNADKYHHVYDSILAEGHTTGNHTWTHLNGWVTSTKKYLNDIERASGLINSNIFRPPYGRISPCQYLQIKKKYEIIMWTHQFADYRRGFNLEKVNLRFLRTGNILLLHDSVQSINNTLPLLKKILSLKSSSTFRGKFQTLNIF